MRDIFYIIIGVLLGTIAMAWLPHLINNMFNLGVSLSNLLTGILLIILAGIVILVIGHKNGGNKEEKNKHIRMEN